MSREGILTQDKDTVFPGEDWFFYWKTSISLWRTKLSELRGVSRVIVPINWSFHSDVGEKADFGDYRPETNLAKLSEIAEELDIEVVYFMPMTPAPFLQNGGLPHFLSRTISLDFLGMGHAQIGPNDELFKLYSWYDSKVFQAYSKFIQAIGDYFHSHQVSSAVYGMRCGYFSEGRYHTFLEDTGKEFHEAFSRYLNAKLSYPQSNFEKPQDERGENLLKHEFQNLIMSLYRTSIEDGLCDHFEGVVDVNFLGSSGEDSLKRLMHNDDVKKYSREIFETISKKMIVSSTLLPHYIKNGVFGHQLKELVSADYLNQVLSPNFGDDGFLNYVPLCFFELYENSFNSSLMKSSWKKVGVLDYLYEKYRFSFSIIEESKFVFSEEGQNVDKKIYYLHGLDLNQKRYSDMLKLFMSGGQILLDRSSLDSEYLRKLEIFFIENDLKVETIRQNCLVSNIELGMGRIVLFEGSDLKDLSLDLKKDFWKKLLSTFNILHLDIEVPSEIQVAWRSRNVSSSELNFEEVRRVSLYNLSSYKKKVKVPQVKNFALLKIVDKFNVNILNWSQETEIEFLPEGYVSLDFGVYS